MPTRSCFFAAACFTGPCMLSGFLKWAPHFCIHSFFLLHHEDKVWKDEFHQFFHSIAQEFSVKVESSKIHVPRLRPKYFFGTSLLMNQRIVPNSKSADGIYLLWNTLVLILLKQQAKSAMILLRKTNFNFGKVNVKRFLKIHCQHFFSVCHNPTKVLLKKDYF